MNTLAFISRNHYMNSNNKKIILIIIGIFGFGIIAATSYFFLSNAFLVSNVSKINNLTKQHIDESLSLHSQAPVIINTDSQNKNIMIPAAAVIGCSLQTTATNTHPTPSTTAYSVDIKNVGTQSCQNTSMSTYYVSGETFISGTPKPTVANYYWVLGQLDSWSSLHIVFTTSKQVSNTEQTESCITADNALQDACTVYNDVIVSPSSPDPVKTSASSPVLDKKENGVWVWKSPMTMDQSYRDFIISTAQQNNFNVIYVTINDYLTIALLPDGPSKNDQKKQYMDALELLVKQANQSGIAIDAETGWRDWAEPVNTYKPFAIVDFVKEYNATRTYKLRALQYDIEPYLLPTYEKNKAALLKNFVSLIDQTVTRLDGGNIAFAIVIPHFYDDAQNWTPSFVYNNENNFTFNHLLNILERKPGSSIILMSYRNFASGADGTIEISQVEIQEATNDGYKTQIIIAQETGNVSPDYVTFFNTSKDYFTEQTNIVKQTFLPYKNFGGMATHYLEPFTQLK